MFKKLVIHFLVIAVLLPVICRGDESSTNLQIKEMVVSYFERILDLPRSDIQLKFVHLPKAELIDSNKYQYLIESKRVVPRLGYQTLWLKVFDNQVLVKQFHIMVDLSIYIDVVIATKKLKRGEIVQREKISIKRLKFSWDYGNLIKSINSAVGLATKQVIREGEILKRSWLREPPDIRRGDKIKVQILSRDLVVTTSGEVKEDGLVGDKVKIVCAATGKHVYGIVQSPQLVTIQLK